MTENWFNWINLLFIPGMLIGFTIHELGHALVAYYFGDYAQAEKGKITANPIKHISWLGSFLFLFFGIGWPKPIVFNPKNFKNRYLDSYLVALAGPLANLALSLFIFIGTLLIMTTLLVTEQIDQSQFSDIMFFGRVSRLATDTTALQNGLLWIIVFSNRIWVANFILGVISLIPLPPFDGFTIALSLVGLFREKRIHDLTGSDHPVETVSQSPQKVPASSGTNTSALTEPISAEAVKTNKKQSMAEIHFKIGTDYHTAKKLDDAIARYRQSITIDPSFGPAYVNMGLAYKAKDQRNEAIHAFRAATRYAVDERTKNQAWTELQALSALPSSQPGTSDNDRNSGASPWTDTKPAPDWIAFAISLSVLLLMVFCLFGLFLVSWL